MIIMERVTTLLWPLLGLTCVLLQLHAAQGRWLGSEQQELPSCGHGGVPGLDCYDPPDHPLLPPCERPSFDCWPPASRVGPASPAAFKSMAHQKHGIPHVQQELPPCGPEGVPGFDCYDPPGHPLLPCDFNHQRIGFDCSGWSPASHVDAASPAELKSKSMAHHQHGTPEVQAELPPCGPGGVPGFDCYDPPNHPLPPCDFNHQRIGFDCSGWPPASHMGTTSPAAFRSKGDAHQEGAVHVQQELPPCGPEGVPGTDCYDPPNHPLPSCDFNHQRIGFDCSGWPPAGSDSLDHHV